jgi:hypothetical protein
MILHPNLYGIDFTGNKRARSKKLTLADAGTPRPTAGATFRNIQIFRLFFALSVGCRNAQSHQLI